MGCRCLVVQQLRGTLQRGGGLLPRQLSALGGERVFLPCSHVGGNKLLLLLSQLPLLFPAASMPAPLDPGPSGEEERECIRNSEGKNLV